MGFLHEWISGYRTRKSIHNGYHGDKNQLMMGFNQAKRD
jgi:hypothetical protein